MHKFLFPACLAVAFLMLLAIPAGSCAVPDDPLASSGKLDSITLHFQDAKGAKFNYTFTEQVSYVAVPAGSLLYYVSTSFRTNTTEAIQVHTQITKEVGDGTKTLVAEFHPLDTGNGTLQTWTNKNIGYVDPDPGDRMVEVAEGVVYHVTVNVAIGDVEEDYGDPKGYGLYSSVAFGTTVFIEDVKGNTDSWVMGIIWCIIAFLPPIIINQFIPRYGIAIGLILSMFVLAFADSSYLWVVFPGLLTIGLILYHSRRDE